MWHCVTEEYCHLWYCDTKWYCHLWYCIKEGYCQLWYCDTDWYCHLRYCDTEWYCHLWYCDTEWYFHLCVGDRGESLLLSIHNVLWDFIGAVKQVITLYHCFICKIKQQPLQQQVHENIMRKLKIISYQSTTLVLCWPSRKLNEWMWSCNKKTNRHNITYLWFMVLSIMKYMIESNMCKPTKSWPLDMNVKKECISPKCINSNWLNIRLIQFQ